MTLIIEIVSTLGKSWFSGGVRRWVEEHPEFSNYFDIVNETTLSMKINRIEIGRSRKNHIIFFHPKEIWPDVSGKHTIIEKKGSDYYIIDNKSTYGTFLLHETHTNFEKIVSPTKLKNGDKIILGNITAQDEDSRIATLEIHF